jgi:hypothetical protein
MIFQYLKFAARAVQSSCVSYRRPSELARAGAIIIGDRDASMSQFCIWLEAGRRVCVSSLPPAAR